MDNITHEVRIMNWKSVIEQCHARPSGQTQKQWLAENHISEKSYYYWQRQIRRETYSLSDASQTKNSPMATETSFVEVPFSVRHNGAESFCPDAVVKTENLILEVSNTASLTLLRNLLEALAYAQ